MLSALVLATVLTVPGAPPQNGASGVESACSGLSPAERGSLFIVPAPDVERVAPLREQRYHVSRSNALPVLTGAIIYVRPGPSMTVEHLRHVARCHLAEAQAHPTGCPLVVRGAESTIAFDGERFVVGVRSSDEKTAGEILAMASNLVPSRGS